MANDESNKRLPQVLPPEEDPTALDDGGNRDMATTEEAWFKNTLSGHTLEAAALRNELARAYIENVNADRAMRKTYAGRILLYLECYSGGVGLLLLLSGLHIYTGFLLEQTVATTLVGSTAIAAIGLVGFVARGLFRSPPPPPSTRE